MAQAVVTVTAVTTIVVIMAMAAVTGLMEVTRAPMEAVLVLVMVVMGLMEAVPLMAVTRVRTGLHRLHLQHPPLETPNSGNSGRQTGPAQECVVARFFLL